MSINFPPLLIPCIILSLITYETHAKLMFTNEIVEINDISHNQSETLPFEFIFKNEGSLPIEISHIKTFCGCTVAKSSQRSYVPGEEGSIKGTYHPRGQKGKQEHLIEVQTNNLGQSRIPLKLRISLRPPLEIHPKLLYWRTGTTAQTKDISITTTPEIELTPKAIDYSGSAFTVKTKKDAGNRVTNIQITPRSTEYPLSESLRIITYTKEGKKIEHSIYMLIK